MSKQETTNVYCPICKRNGRNKLLFRKMPQASGRVLVWCRQCKAEIEIDLEDKSLEPRVSDTPSVF